MSPMTETADIWGAVERERNYWNKRYALGCGSGRESNEQIWELVEEEIPNIEHIIDVGCGDLRLWGERNCQDYVGIDISEQVLKENIEKRPHWNFVCAPAETFIPGITRENVFCFNMIYHILEPENVKQILRNLCRYATKRIFIYTMVANPFYPEVADGNYQYYHSMEDYIPLFNEMGFALTSLELIDVAKKYGAPCGLYIFKREHFNEVEEKGVIVKVSGVFPLI